MLKYAALAFAACLPLVGCGQILVDCTGPTLDHLREGNLLGDCEITQTVPVSLDDVIWLEEVLIVPTEVPVSGP